MPCVTNAVLPLRVRTALPEHAQDIFREAFIRAWKEYADPCKRGAVGTQEEISFKVAWAAVEKKYEKDKQGVWQLKSRS